jgi:NAD(P)H-hydrate epimerase
MIRLTRQQVQEVDRRAIEEYGIPGIVLMENASRAAADVAERMLRTITGRSAMILCGGGNNGGDGLAAARHLHNRGFAVRIGLCTDPAGYKGDALINWRIVQAMKLPSFQATPEAIEGTRADLIIDAIFGTGLTQPPRPPFDKIVAAVEKTGRPVLAVDLPSGLDCDTGQPLGACIRAERTVTFVAEKVGFGKESAREFTGEVVVADIGCPRELLESVSC